MKKNNVLLRGTTFTVLLLLGCLTAQVNASENLKNKVIEPTNIKESDSKAVEEVLNKELEGSSKKSRRKKVEMCQGCGKPEPQCTCDHVDEPKKKDHKSKDDPSHSEGDGHGH